MKFAKFSEYLQKLETTTSRNEMTVILAGLLKKAKEEEVGKVCYLALGRLGPKFASIQFNMAVKMMVQVLSVAYRVEKGKVVREFKKVGDLGEVASKLKVQSAKCKLTLKSSKLSVDKIYSRLREIAEESGGGSVERKIEKMAKLLRELDSVSVKYVVRIPLEKLRLGFSDMTILDALSWMLSGDKSKREEIERAYNVRADVGEIARLVKRGGLGSLGKLGSLGVRLGTPVVPALCQRLPTAEKMVEKMIPRQTRGKLAVEPKFDGQRLQVHYQKSLVRRKVSVGLHPGGVNIFTRNLDDVTHMFPDIVEALKRGLKAKEVILDGEAVGFDPKTGKLLPFQETIKRKRKHGVKQAIKRIPLKFYCFDVLYKDGKSLLGKAFKERRKILEKILRKGNKTIILSPQIVTDSPQVIRRFHNEQIKKGLEGAVLKKWEAAYDPGRRGYTWVKFKSEKGKKGGGLADTIDCLVMGFNRGRGKRAAFGIGAFLVGVKVGKVPRVPRVPRVARGDFVTVSKIGTGLSDEQWKEMRRRGEKVKTGKKVEEYQVDKNLFPDVWCKPEIVVEIEADNITKSPVHTAGYALRFPRLVRFREDKDPEQVTTVKEVESLYRMQRG